MNCATNLEQITTPPRTLTQRCHRACIHVPSNFVSRQFPHNVISNVGTAPRTRIHSLGLFAHCTWTTVSIYNSPLARIVIKNIFLFVLFQVRIVQIHHMNMLEDVARESIMSYAYYSDVVSYYPKYRFLSTKVEGWAV